MKAGGGTAYVAVDADAMGELAHRLEQAADELQLAWSGIGSTLSRDCLPMPCAIGIAREVEDEMRDAAESVRRRHADVLGRCLVDAPGAVSWRVRLPSAAPKRAGGWKGWVHGLLDGAGMAPVVGEPFDLLNGLWYAAEGKWADAALSMAALVPTGGQLASGSRYLDDAADAGRKIAGQGKYAAVLRRGNLTMDELLAMERSGGHALSRRVGQTVEQLTERQLREGLPIVSTFHSAADVLVAANRALSEHMDEVAAFLNGGDKYLRLVVDAPGLGVVLDAGRLLPGTHAKIVIKWVDEDAILLTAMVERL